MPHPLLLTLVLIAGCTAPDLPAISIEPAEPTSADDLLVQPTPEPGDLWSWVWTRDGQIVPEVVSDRVPAELTAKGERWSVTVQSHINGRVSEEGTAEVSIRNSPPEVAVRFSPDPIRPGEPLMAVVTASDVDEDPLELSYVWTRGESSFPQNVDTVPGSEVRGGDRWSVAVTASDGEDSATASTSGEAANLPPSITSARIVPEYIDETSVLEVVWDAIDPDGDPVEVQIAWEVGGLQLPPSETLDGTFFDRDDEIRAWLLPSDGVSEGDRYPTPIVIVQNTAPSATGVVITPSVLTEGTVATCELVNPYDLDGDLVTTSVRWYNAGTLVSTAPALTGLSFSKGDVIGCEASPTDGSLIGEAMFSDFADIENSPPSVGVVTFDPPVPTAAGPVTAVVDGVYDPDPIDTPTLMARWYVDGVFVGEALTWDGLVRDQVVYVEMVADDGEDLSPSVRSAEVVVGNAPPTIARAAMIPAEPTSADEVTADVIAVDADLDPVSIEVQWFANGAPIFVGDPLPEGLISEGDELYYVATPSDPSGVGIPASSPEALVGNGPPQVASASISPAVLHPASTASCLPAGASDPDGDGVSYDYLWWINGVDSGTSATLSGFVLGDIVRCQLTPTDGDTSGAPVWSAPVTVQ